MDDGGSWTAPLLGMPLPGQPVPDDAGALFYDLLTGVVSQSSFERQLDRMLERLPRASSTVAVLLLQVRDLALLHDRVGSQTHDEVLGVAATRLRSCLRQVDVVARLGADTFGVILETNGGPAQSEAMAGEVASRLVSVFAEPLTTTTADLAVEVAIGIARSDGTPLTPAELVRRAQLALHQAAGTTEGFRIFEPARHDAAVRRLHVRGALGRAIERDALSLRYQPLVSMRTGTTLGLEALLRWDDPEHGAMPPSEFIPVAEETSLIVPIGEWVLRTALRQRAAWRDDLPGLPVIGLSVNVSARQLAQPGLVDSVQEGLEETGLTPETLLLEVTESTLMADDDVVRSQIQGLRALGVRLGLDDFGTGWSSLEYLSRLPVDVLKIAQVFVDQVGTSSRATALVRAIIDLAHSLGLITVAEGVETEEQADRLRQMGCFLGQGWHYARELDVPNATEEMRRLAHPRLAGGAP